MSDESKASSTQNRRKYDRMMLRRVRIGNLAARARDTTIQLVWLVVLIAGAAIPLTEALATDGWTWVSPVLGFVVVVTAGLERIFSRSTDAAVALDRLRRDLARERRLLLAGSEPYADCHDPFRLYASRSEEAIAAYDDKMTEYHARVLTDAQ